MSTDIARTGAELELAAQVVELLRRVAGPAAEAEVTVQHDAEALTRFANSMIHQNVAEAATTVRLRLHLDGRTASAATTLTDPDGLAALVERTVAAARMSPPDLRWPGLTPPTELHRSAGYHGSGARSGLDFGFDEATARANPAERAERVRDFVRAAEGLETAGYCRTTYSSAAFANTAGQAVEGRTAEAAMDGIARVEGSDGVARLASGRLADLDGAVLGARAAAKARAGRRPIELPPGRYEVILEPDAVADLLGNLAMFGFNGKAFAQRQSFAELGADQFDPSVTIVDEPLGSRADPAAGLPFDVEGTPRDWLVLVREGVTQAVTHDRSSAAEAGTVSTGHASESSRTWGPMACNMRLEASSPPPEPADPGVPSADPHTTRRDGPTPHPSGPAGSTGSTPGPGGPTASPSGSPANLSGPTADLSGPTASPSRRTASPSGPTASSSSSAASSSRRTAGLGGPAADSGGPTAESARPMVARMERGLLITDFWYTRVLDQKALVVTGLTRNGVWLVEDGEVIAAVGNMRFTQSYPQALGPGLVLGIGSQSVLLPDRWSGVRFAAPALHLASWNLTGNASG
jgi:predicted Zn-dependent protease